MNIDFTNGILFIDDKIVDGNQIRAMSDQELKQLINELYELGITQGAEDTYDDAYNDGYNEGYADCIAESEGSI